jgi:hemerythrin-like domain-containing protein
MTERNTNHSRREMVRGAGLVAGTTLVLGQAAWSQARETVPRNELTPMEDLVRQHALAGRVLMVYQMVLGRTSGVGMSPPPQAIGTAAGMVRSFVEDYHVRLEEEHLFPLMQKTGRMKELINVLREQHAAGRRLTDVILQTTSGGTPRMEVLSRNIMAYLNMIGPHTAYEETVLYPQIRTALPDREYEQLQRTLAEAGRKKLGPEGFNGLLQKVTDLEKSVGVTSLAQFTPKVRLEPVARENPPR